MHASSPFLFADRPGRWRVRVPSLAAVVALHVAVVVLLLQFAPVREALGVSAPIMVSLFTPPSVAAVPPMSEPAPPKPSPRPVRRPTAPAPIIAAPIESPSPNVAPAAPPEPMAPEPTPPPAAPQQALSAAPLPPVIPPSFSADYLHNPAPAYPLLSRRMNEQGRVVLRVLVTADGAPETVELRTSSGSARLDGAALETVKRWKFVPARQGERPVTAWVLVPISFALEG
jgi:protein TonB